MKKWYIFYSSNKTNQKLQQLVAELQTSDNKQKTKLQQLGAEIQEAEFNDELGLAFPLAFSFVPWGHHIEITTKWAITIHRSQEMTFERMHFDLSHGTFLPGQAYVAISRLRSLEGLTLGNPIHPYHVTQNQEVRVFANSYNDTE